MQAIGDGAANPAPALIRRLAGAFANISVIDVSRLVEQLRQITLRLTGSLRDILETVRRGDEDRRAGVEQAVGVLELERMHRRWQGHGHRASLACR